MGPVVYNFANSGRSWTMEYNETTHKLLNMGQDDLNVSLFDFNPVTGVLSNEQQLYFGAMDAYIGNFSPDGSKIYVGLGSNVLDLWQYDINNNIWTNMNTCCWAHDIKTGPNGITYFINTYNGANPLSKMTNANLTAVGNACGYSPIASPGNFNGEVRRFPEFLQIPDPPVANLDLVSFTGGSILINPLTNDYDPQSDAFSLTGIFSGPSNGTVIINGNQITYFPFSGICNGTDTITYMITDVSCMCDTAQIIINFLGVNPVSSFSFVQSCNGTVTFNNQSLNATTFTWDFGDSSRLQSVINPTYNYIVSGSYTVKLIALNACNSDTFILNLSVNVINPALAVFSSLQQSCSLLLNFTNQSQNGASYAWDFGDGFLETNYNTSHTYLISGSYFVTLIVSNTCSSDTLTKQISVNDIPDFHAEYLYEAGICTNTINFTDQSLNSVSSFWDFGDGNFSTLIYPSHTYLVSGIYNVILISNGKCAADTVFFVVNNSFSVGVASFEIIQQPCETQIQFLNQSLNSYSVFWDFGDGFEDHSSNPIHSYFSGGEYVVELYINQGTQCFDSAEMTIKVHDPVITSLYVPNCFTPNNDGKNELFEIYGTIDCESYQLYIYNRWGSLVYKTDDIWKFWDGKMNGNEVREGVYAYLIIGKNFLKNGSVSLIR